MTTMKISELIKVLQSIKMETKKDLPVILKGDPTGDDNLGTLHYYYSFGYGNGIVTLRPYEKFTDIKCVEGYINEQ